MSPEFVQGAGSLSIVVIAGIMGMLGVRDIMDKPGSHPVLSVVLLFVTLFFSSFGAHVLLIFLTNKYL